MAPLYTIAARRFRRLSGGSSGYRADVREPILAYLAVFIANLYVFPIPESRFTAARLFRFAGYLYRPAVIADDAGVKTFVAQQSPSSVSFPARRASSHIRRTYAVTFRS